MRIREPSAPGDLEGSRKRRRRREPTTTTSLSLGVSATNITFCCYLVVLLVDSAGSLQSPNVFTAPTSRTTSHPRRRQSSNSHSRRAWLGFEVRRFAIRSDAAGGATVLDDSSSTRREEDENCSCSSALALPSYWNQKQQISNNDEEDSALPPWLARFGSSTRDQARQELAWLLQSIQQYTSNRDLLDHVRQSIQDISDPSVAVGCCEFVQTLMKVCSISASGSSSYGTKDVGELICAAIPHYVQCVNLREQGGSMLASNDDWSLLGPIMAMEQQQSTQQPPATSTATSSSCLVWTSPQDDDIPTVAHEKEECVKSEVVQRLVRDAAKIKRTEMLAGLFLGAGSAARASSTISNNKDDNHWQTASMAIQSLLLSVTGDDVRALVLRCVACLFRLQGAVQYYGNNEYIERTPQLIHAAKQGLSVYAVLAQRLGLPQLKARIENTAFSILYRRQYQAVTSRYYGGGGGGGGEVTTAAAANEGQQALQSISNFLMSDLQATIQGDQKLLAQLQDWQVSCRVKEPYSFWKKLLQKRSKLVPTAGASGAKSDKYDDSQSTNTTLSLSSSSSASLVPVVSKLETSYSSSSDGSNSSVLAPDTTPTAADEPVVNDVIGLRVILKARKWHEHEDDETTRARERLLCYYVQNVLKQKWGATRIKDYIQRPKPNGYQSLHHTSVVRTSGNGIINNGLEFPFEVQVRSEEMHQAAEYGMASHWTYKLGGSNSEEATVHGASEEIVDTTTTSESTADNEVVDTTTTSESTADSGEPSTTAPTLESALLLPSLSTSRTNKENEDEEVATTTTTSSPSGASQPLPHRGTTGSYLDALVTAKDALKQNIYVFMARRPSQNSSHNNDEGLGQLLLLPRNAQIQDALMAALEKGVAEGNHTSNTNGEGDYAVASPARRTVWRNGRVASLEEPVENGDVLLVTP